MYDKLIRFNLLKSNLSFMPAVFAVTLIVLIVLTACSPPPRPTSLVFTPSYKGSALSCEAEFMIGTSAWRYRRFEFFISNVELQNQQGQWQRWPMLQSKFQYRNVALLGHHCPPQSASASGQVAAQSGNWQIQFDPLLNPTEIQNIRFTLGVPFDLNHAFPLSQPSPLNLPSMFWVWRTGHKFLRLELQSNDDNWLFHLGSTGCKSASAVRAPQQQCLHPNRIQIEMPFADNTAGTNPIVFDLSPLLHNLRPRQQSSCQSEPDNKACKILLNNLNPLNRQTPVFRRSL